MNRLNLTSWQRRRLRRQLAETRDVRLFRRTLAVLEFDHGRSAADIARMLGATRQSVYNWVEAYTQDHDPVSLADEGGRGRHPLLDGDHEHLLEAILAVLPQDLGYPHVSWTVPLLREVLEIATEQRVSEDTLRRALDRLDYVWKRPLRPGPEARKRDSSLISTTAPRNESQVMLCKRFGCHAHGFVSMSQGFWKAGALHAHEDVSMAPGTDPTRGGVRRGVSKKTPHLPADSSSAAAQRRVGPGRDPPVAVPAVAPLGRSAAKSPRSG